MRGVGATNGGATGAGAVGRDDGAARTGVVAGGAALVVLAVVAGLLATRGGEDGPATVLAEPTPTPSATSTAPAAPECSTAERRFIPTAVTIPGVVRKVSVVPMLRDANNVPGIPPLTSTGKTEMAFDLGSGIRPGDLRGNALLNAHTYPDGSALGNKLLAGLHKGDRIDVLGPVGRICYRVTDRVEVPATDRGLRYYAKDGEPQVAIVVCSGKRLGPGEWTKRTLWFASPVA